MSRYEAPDSEGTFEPGSHGRVLSNKLGITAVEEMEDTELDLLEQLYNRVFREQFPVRELCVQDLKDWHRQWLGRVYPWAGELRTVNMSKGEFPFAAAHRIPDLLSRFQEECLDRYTPCEEVDTEALVTAIAVTHAELILIHPFREGNGRLARLLADVMSVQAHRSLLDYRDWDENREGYFAAIHAALGEDYLPMKIFVRSAMEEA